MYSLYRAWLSLGPCSGIASAINSLPVSLPSPPPAPLNLTTLSTSGPTTSSSQLPGVPDVTLQVGPNMTQFSAHKSVLSAHSGYFKAALMNHTGLSPIAVPNVNVDEFSSLLTFMYTGYLDLNISNIYNILLATHILHMPRALEICRSFLMQSQNPNRTNIIKPIPSRKTVSHPQIFQPQPTFTNISHLQKHEDTPFRTVTSTSNGSLDDNVASTSKGTQQNEVQTTQTIVTEERIRKKTDVKYDRSCSSLKKQKRKESCDSNNHGNDKNVATNENKEKVVVDIACCDGPVRFHRVINKNYGFSDNNFEEANSSTPPKFSKSNATINKLINANLRDKLDEIENDSSNSAIMGSSSQSTPNGEVFTCLYCNHTFKSQYCYQKHARRHLNPVSIEAKSQQTKEMTVKREVKLLDMNVQYYPCKTCGSKFPSYYFVHKHRKLCHAEEMADNGNKNNEIVMENAVQNVENSNSSSSAIDVEGGASDTTN